MQIELLANQLTMKLSDGFNKHAGTDIKYASIIFNDFEENYKTKYNLDDIYNFCLYDNYYGNILNKLINQVFIPYLEDLSIDFNDNSTYYNKMLSKLQIHDILSIIFKIINNNNCNINQRDYYSNMPINNLIEISNNTKDLPLFFISL